MTLRDSTDLDENEKAEVRARYAKVCLIHTREEACELVAKEFGTFEVTARLLTACNIPRALM